MLIELLMVLNVIALITAVAAPRFFRYVVGGAKASTAQTKAENLVSSVELSFLETGRYPTENDGLSILVSPPEDGSVWSGPSLRKSGGTIDPLGEPNLYRSPGRFVELEICSYGSDGQKVGARALFQLF